MGQVGRIRTSRPHPAHLAHLTHPAYLAHLAHPAY